MPRRTLGGTLSISPNPGPQGVEQEYTITGSGFPTDGEVNIGAHGETSWVDNVGVWANGVVVGGAFQLLYLRNFPYDGEIQVQARAPGTGKTTPGGAQVPALIAAVTLEVE